MQSSLRMYSYRQKAKKQYDEKHFHVPAQKKIALSFFLFLSIFSTLLALKMLFFIPISIVCSFFTYQLYIDLEYDALSEAKRMRKNLSLQEINSAFKKPPSPKFDQHVRVKMIELIKKDAFKVTK